MNYLNRFGVKTLPGGLETIQAIRVSIKILPGIQYSGGILLPSNANLYASRPECFPAGGTVNIKKQKNVKTTPRGSSLIACGCTFYNSHAAWLRRIYLPFLDNIVTH